MNIVKNQIRTIHIQGFPVFIVICEKSQYRLIVLRSNAQCTDEKSNESVEDMNGTFAVW